MQKIIAVLQTTSTVLRPRMGWGRPFLAQEKTRKLATTDLKWRSFAEAPEMVMKASMEGLLAADDGKRKKHLSKLFCINEHNSPLTVGYPYCSHSSG